MPIPDVAEVVVPTLRLISQGVTDTGVITARLADAFNLTAEEREERLPNRQGVLRNRVAFVLRFAGPAGATTMLSPGVYALTEHGKRLLACPEPDVVATIMRRSPAQPRGAMAASAQPEAPVRTEAESLFDAVDAAERALRVDLMQSVRALKANRFEDLIRDLLARLGYGIAELHRGGAGDEGVDGILRQDALGLERVVSQAKKYAADRLVTPAQVREFVGALTNAGATKGVLATTSGFTSAARDALPRSNAAARVVLIDGEDLAGLLVEHEVGIRTERTIRIRRIDLGAYSTG